MSEKLSFWDLLRGKTLPQIQNAVEWTDSHDDYFQRNMVAYRTPLGAYGDYGQIYRQQPAVRTTVDFLARNIAQLNPKVYERLEQNDRLELDEHPLAVLLRYPGPTTARFSLLRDLVSDLAIYDRAYWLKMKIRGRIRALARIRPRDIWLDQRNDEPPRWHTSLGQTYARDEVVVITGYSPDESEGVSPLETLRRVLAEEWASSSNREAFWRNAARPGGVIERPKDAGNWSDDARKRFREQWQAAHSGTANSGKTPVLEDGMTLNTAAFSPKDSEYIEGRKLTYEEVAIAYFGPMVGGRMASVLKGDAQNTHTQVYQDVLAPYLRQIQDEIELQLLPEVDSRPKGRVYVEFNLAEKLKGSFEEQAKSLVTAVGVPYMSVNEGRSRLNMARIDEEWADDPVQPLNVMYGGQPAVTVPTEDPGDA